MPAQSILIEKAPQEAEAYAERREKRCQHAPPSQFAIKWRTIESREMQMKGAKSQGRTGIHDERKFVDRPQDDRERQGPQSENGKRCLHSRQAGGSAEVQPIEDCSKNCRRYRHYREIY